MKSKLILIFAIFVCSPFCGFAQADSLLGKWNLILEENGKKVPMWLEIKKSGVSTLVGSYCYKFGSARPVSEIEHNNGFFSFSVPNQWEPKGFDMRVSGMIDGDDLKGTLIFTDGSAHSWVGKRAPKLNYTANPKWGSEIKLFNGKDLSGWSPFSDKPVPNQWIVEDGILRSPTPGANLVSNEKFKDFRLQMEFRYPKGSNSGLYLRGRYEVQITDDVGKEPSSVYFGGVYGHLIPNEMAAKLPGEWQKYDITLIGRRVTIVANGKTIIADQNIPGMTGGALDNDEASAGPIMLQGDHGPVDIKSIVITPVMN